MLENRDDLMSIVVLEAGASWPPWLSEYQRLAPNAVVIAQAAAEPAAVFESRVLHRIAEASANSDVGPIRVGVIVSADTAAESRLAMRQNVARALLQAMGKSHEAELVLAGDSEELESSRQAMFVLAGSLCEELGGTNVSVRVRFSNGKSGVMRSVAQSSPDVDKLISKA